MPLSELPAQELRDYGRSPLGQTDWGARLTTVDWEVLPQSQADAADPRHPELEPLRTLGLALRVRFRGEVARKDWDGATRTAKTMFALARHLGEYPAGAGNRTGLAVAGLALDTLDEMLQQPGCPNLYWALTDLPCPLVELRRGVQGDCAAAMGQLRALKDDDVMTDEQLEELVGRLSGRLGLIREQAGQPLPDFRGALRRLAADRGRVATTRARIMDAAAGQGVLEKLAALRVMAYPDLQIVLLDERWRYEIRRDEELKLLALAPWQIDTVRPERPQAGLFDDLLPKVVELRCEQARLEQRIALLRHVEALRLYAAAHEGRLPSRLEDVRVPLPADPFTGRPFAYAAEGPVARVRGAGATAAEMPAALKTQYEVTVRRDEPKPAKGE